MLSEIKIARVLLRQQIEHWKKENEDREKTEEDRMNERKKDVGTLKKK